MKLLRLASVLVIGLGCAGLELFAGAVWLRVGLAAPTRVESAGGVGAVSLGCFEAFGPLVLMLISIAYVVAARRRGGGARWLAIVYGMTLVPLLLLSWSGAFVINPRVHTLLLAGQLLVSGIATAIATWYIVRYPVAKVPQGPSGTM